MSDLARKLITANKYSLEKFIDLGNCGLKEIPAEVADLVWLESLSLASAWLERDGQRLEWRRTRNAGAENTLADLTPLERLSCLRHLYLRGMGVIDLTPLASLPFLQTVDLGRTGVTDLAPLVGLSGLRSLHLERTSVINLGPLANLSALKDLGLSQTLVADLTPLALLPDLRFLDVSGTQVTDLAPLIHLIRRGSPVNNSWSQPWRGEGIYVGDCPLIRPPLEIVARGNDAILNYFFDLSQGGVDHLYEAKMLIVGEGGAGKTSLLMRLYSPDEPLPAEGDSTKGIKIHKHEFKLKNGRAFRLNVWDFGGQQIYHATHQFFLTHRSLYLLLDDTRKDHKSVSDEGFKYWLELIDVFSGHSPILIFQNEKGGRSKQIDIGGIKQRYDNVKELYAGNLEHGAAADRVREGIEFFASTLSHIGEELPARWIKVRADIEARARNVPHITVQEYFDIYSGHMNFDRSKALYLSRYLHDLGVFLHFQDDSLLARTVILQNEWATEAVFRLLDDETVKAKRGRFNSDDCKRLWKDSVYTDMQSELLRLMQRFELCYELPYSDPPIWLAPQLLPPAKPKELADWGKPEDCLVLRYKYDFLPKGMVSRLTVRLHRFVRNSEMAWTTGVLFERDSTAVLVEILPNGSEIELRARGPDRKALLSVVAADLDALNDSFQGLRDKVHKRIPCNCWDCRAASAPEFFDQKRLLKYRQDKQRTIQCPTSYKQMDVLELLDGIKLDKLPEWANAREVSIFLASSAEFSKDRKDFELYFRRLNDEHLKQGLYLKIVLWENFLDAMSKTRLQDEYNKAICECDIFVSLFFTKTGRYTEEEFDVAFSEFKKKDRPRIFTFFKDAPVSIQGLRQEDFNSLRAFQAKLKELGHYPTLYTSTEDLKLKFRDQLDKLLKVLLQQSSGSPGG